MDIPGKENQTVTEKGAQDGFQSNIESHQSTVSQDEKEEEASSSGQSKSSSASSDDEEIFDDTEDLISKKEATYLLQKMISMGYFHDKQHDRNIMDTETNNVDIDDIEEEEEVTIESMKNYQSLCKERFRFQADQNCTLVLPSNLNKENKEHEEDGQEIFCMTREYLNEKIHDLAKENGRLSLHDICKQLKLSMEPDVLIAARHIDHKQSNIHFIENQGEIVSDDYINNIFVEKVLPSLKEKGSICISELAMTCFHVPIEFMVDIVSSRLTHGKGENMMESIPSKWCFEKDVNVVIGNDGAKKLVTSNYEENMKSMVKEMLQRAKEPLKVKDIIEAIDWDAQSIFKEIEILCESKDIEGEVHTDSSYNSMAGAIYIPFIYEENQRQTIIKFFETNGFVTIVQANSTGISMKRCENCILEECNTALVLDSCILNPDIIISPLQVIVESCIDTNSFVDLSIHIPAELTCFKEDIGVIMNEHILINLSKDGCLVIEEKELIYFSAGMISNILDEVLPPLIEDFARSNAESIADKIDQGKEPANANETSKSSMKGKGRSKKKSFAKDDLEKSLTYQDFLIPLQTVVEGVMHTYQELIDIQESYSGNFSTVPLWEPEEYNQSYEGPIYTFCRIVVNNTNLSKACSSAIEAEAEKVLQLRQGSSVRKSRVGTAKCRSIEESFEESFPSACYYIQLTAKFSRAILADDISHEEVQVLNRVFLSQCAWFARRITEYCLFKANIESEGVFSFNNRYEEEIDSDEGFSAQMNLTKFYYSKVFFRTQAKSMNPLKLLEEMLPGNVGIGLGRMWMLCGYDYYDCGENHQVGLEEGDFEEFITHIKEFCLPMVGIPFKKLDKKSEKKLMISRRKELIKKLQEASAVKEVFDLALVLLCQQTRSIVLYGGHINSSVMKWILKDKKISSEISLLFKKVFSLMGNAEDPIPEYDINKMKECGLAKDIHSITFS